MPFHQPYILPVCPPVKECVGGESVYFPQSKNRNKARRRWVIEYKQRI